MRAASSSPDGEPPAWMITGCPCGQRAMLIGPLTLKNRPLWSSGRTLRGVDILPGRLVGDDRAVLPAIPQPLDDVDELLGALIAQFVVELVVEAVILVRLQVRGGDHVPGGAAAADDGRSSRRCGRR